MVCLRCKKFTAAVAFLSAERKDILFLYILTNQKWNRVAVMANQGSHQHKSNWWSSGGLGQFSKNNNADSNEGNKRKVRVMCVYNFKH